MSIIVNDLIEEYIEGLYTSRNDFLKKLRDEGESEGIPIITKDTENFLSVLLTIQRGDTVEVFGPYTHSFDQTVDILLDENDVPIDSAPHAQQMIKIKMKKPVGEHFMLRKKRKES